MTQKTLTSTHAAFVDIPPGCLSLSKLRLGLHHINMQVGPKYQESVQEILFITKGIWLANCMASFLSQITALLPIMLCWNKKNWKSVGSGSTGPAELTHIKQVRLFQFLCQAHKIATILERKHLVQIMPSTCKFAKT